MAQQVPISKMITVQMQRALERPELISLAAGFVDNETLPVERAGSVFQEIFAEPSLAKAALQYGTTAGYPPLRDVVLSRLAQSDGVSREEYGAAVEQVLVTAGSNQLLHLLSEVMLDPGDVVLCAAPTYFVVLGTLAGCGAQAMGVATDDHGMIPEALAEQFAAFHCRGQSNRVKLVYVVSYSDNPRGVTMPRERREQLLEVVDRHNRQVHSGGEHPAEQIRRHRRPRGVVDPDVRAAFVYRRQRQPNGLPSIFRPTGDHEPATGFDRVAPSVGELVEPGRVGGHHHLLHLGPSQQRIERVQERRLSRELVLDLEAAEASKAAQTAR